MPTPYDDVIAQERRYNELLRAKLAHSDERLLMLENLARQQEDPFRALLLREALGVDAAVRPVQPAPQQAASATIPVQHRAVEPVPWDQLPSGLRQLIEFIGEEEKSLADLGPFLEEQQLLEGKEAKRVLFDFKKYGVLDNFRRGHYRLSERGRELLAQQSL